MKRVCRRALAKHGLVHRGHGSQDLVACLQRSDGERVITVDDAAVRVVRSYKHLGTIHPATGNMTEDARARVRATMAVYRALAGRVFGSGGHIVVVHSSLCQRDLERVHAHSAEVLQITAHMRVLRKCAGRCRQQTPNSAWSCKCLGYRHCCVVSDCDMWRALPERGRRSSVLSCRMRAERLRYGWH